MLQLINFVFNVVHADMENKNVTNITLVSNLKFKVISILLFNTFHIFLQFLFAILNVNIYIIKLSATFLL